jgi:hypothetical protein
MVEGNYVIDRRHFSYKIREEESMHLIPTFG